MSSTVTAYCVDRILQLPTRQRKRRLSALVFLSIPGRIRPLSLVRSPSSYEDISRRGVVHPQNPVHLTRLYRRNQCLPYLHRLLHRLVRLVLLHLHLHHLRLLLLHLLHLHRLDRAASSGSSLHHLRPLRLQVVSPPPRLHRRVRRRRRLLVRDQCARRCSARTSRTYCPRAKISLSHPVRR